MAWELGTLELYIMVENGRTDIVLKQHCEDILLAMPGRSKLLPVIFINWSGKKGFSCMPSARGSTALHLGKQLQLESPSD